MWRQLHFRPLVRAPALWSGWVSDKSSGVVVALGVDRIRVLSVGMPWVFTYHLSLQHQLSGPGQAWMMDDFSSISHPPLVHVFTLNASRPPVKETWTCLKEFLVFSFGTTD